LLLPVLACGSALPPAGGNAPQPPAPAPAAPPTGAPVEPGVPPASPAPPPDPYEATGIEGDLEVRPLGEWSQSPYQRPFRQVIRTQEDLDRVWAALGAQEQPEVDFATDLVVLAALGQRPSGGYDMDVRRAELRDGRLTVEVVETAPGPNCVTTMALTQPVELVALRAARAQTWEFVERREERGC
jgi:hypothetical protein